MTESDDEKRREQEEVGRLMRERFHQQNEAEKVSLLQTRGKKRRPRRYRGGEPEQIPEVTTAEGATLGGGLIYRDVLPQPAPREPEPEVFDYDGFSVEWISDLHPR